MPSQWDANMSTRLCEICDQLIEFDADNFQSFSNGNHRLVVVEKSTGRSHVLLSEKKTARVLAQRQRKAEPQMWVINPQQSPAVEAPTPVEETISTAPGIEQS